MRWIYGFVALELLFLSTAYTSGYHHGHRAIQGQQPIHATGLGTGP
jgi:hypothetical protein